MKAKRNGKKIAIKQQVDSMLDALSEKNREILERRFGRGRDAPETLESIGGSYGITRERVRQIQEYGLRKLKSEDAQKTLASTFGVIEKFIEENSGELTELKRRSQMNEVDGIRLKQFHQIRKEII